ncbi:MAG: dehydratase [Chloroflexi bacterium]|nr:dehydratase [Chloroflexota bacterium]
MPRGVYFEDMEIGETRETLGRTITETDIINFAGVSGDFNPLHINAPYAEASQFGDRIAHGVLGLAVATGQAYSLGFLEGTIIAFLECAWKFRGPIYIGDTIRTISKITKKREMPSAGGGLITFDVKLLNQKDETVQKGTWTVMVASRPGEDAPQQTPASRVDSDHD